MKIDDTLISYLEELSRLRLTASECEDSKENLGKILNYMDKLSEIDTVGVEELSHPFSFTNYFREDEVTGSFNRDKILLNAPEKKDEYFKVPKTLE